jgi:TetR/AcrR family transcriptional repressor of nem operon
MTSAFPSRPRGRPPKIHPGFIETRYALLRAGVLLLTEKGFSATAVDEVLRIVQVPKGSFYHYFDSKEAFGLELIATYSEYFTQRLGSFFDNSAHRPLDRLQAFTIDAEVSMRRHDFRRGCLVGNLGQEMGALPESYRQRLIETLLSWQRRTSECLREAQIADEIGRHQDCDQLAEFFWVGWEGAVLRAKLERDGTPLRVFAKGFFGLVGR